MAVTWQRWILAADDPNELTVEIDVLVDDRGNVVNYVRLMATFRSERADVEAGAIIGLDGSVDFEDQARGSYPTCTLAIHGARFITPGIACQIAGVHRTLTPISWETIKT